MEASIQEEGGGDEVLKLPAEESAATKLQKSSSALDAGSTPIAAEEGGCEEANPAESPTHLPTLSSCGEDEQLHLQAAAPVSYTSTHTSDGGEAPAAHGEDKKLQYTLRSNPKRSRRFLDPDYTLELAPASSPCAPISHCTTLPSNSPAPGAPAPAPPALVKKGNSLFSEKARACTECGKQFPSWKALFGHMRCHPERQWRGIQPPTSISNLRDRSSIAEHTAPQLQHTIRDAENECTGAVPTKLLTSPPTPSFWDQSDSDSIFKARVSRPRLRPSDYDVEESDTESLEAAYMNGRDEHHRPKTLNARGRRSKRSLQDVGDAHFFESSTPPDEVMEERDMADCLVMLSFAAKSKADQSDGDSALLDWKNHVKQSPLMSLTEARKSIELKEKRSYNVQKGIHFLQEGEGMYDRWEEDQEKGSWERKSKFECSTCKKTFRSHQALGGHRASHKKVKGCFARTNAAEEGAIAPDVAAEMSGIALTMATTVEEPHQHQQEEEEEVFDTSLKQKTGDQEEAEPSPAPASLEEMQNMGQFLQFSITCSEKMEDDQTFESAMAPEKLQLKHQTSSCSSSSSIIAATAAAGTLLLHHHHHLLQQPQQPKIHQCSICNRVFSTGQALGGHKRCHWGGSGMPETGKRCPLMRQDSDGGACMMGISTSDQRLTSELSRKGRQDSGSFASAEAWMNISSSSVMEKDFTHISGLTKKGRQDSVASCNDVRASAHGWLGGYVPSEKDQLNLNKLMIAGGASCKEHRGSISAQRGWLEAFSSNPKLGCQSMLQQVVEGDYKQQEAIACCELELVQGGAGEEGESAETAHKGCECSRGLKNEEGEGVNEQVPGLTKMEDMLDLNLPAFAEEEEEKEERPRAAGNALHLTTLPSPSNWPPSSEERVAESAGS